MTAGHHQTPLNSSSYPDVSQPNLPPPDRNVQSPFADQVQGIRTPVAHPGLPGSLVNSTPYSLLTHDLHSSVMSASPSISGLGVSALASPPPVSIPGLGLDISLGSQSLPSHQNNINANGYVSSIPTGALQAATPSIPCSLYVKNLPPEADRLFLYERFAPHGAIHSVKILSDEDTGKCRGVGFVNYGDAKGALKAVQALHGSKLNDKLLHVSFQTHRGRPAG